MQMRHLKDEELIEAVGFGRQARDILENSPVLSNLKLSYHNQWEGCSSPEDREEIWYRLRGLLDIVRELNRLIDYGKVCEQELDRRRKRNA